MSMLIIIDHTSKSSLEADLNLVACRAVSLTTSERAVPTESGQAPAAAPIAKRTRSARKRRRARAKI